MSDNKSNFSDDKFQKTFALSDSNHEGEALNAFRMSKTYLKRYGLTFQKYFQKKEEANALSQNILKLDEENAKLESIISDYEEKINLLEENIFKKKGLDKVASPIDKYMYQLLVDNFNSTNLFLQELGSIPKKFDEDTNKIAAFLLRNFAIDMRQDPARDRLLINRFSEAAGILRQELFNKESLSLSLPFISVNKDGPVHYQRNFSSSEVRSSLDKKYL